MSNQAYKKCSAAYAELVADVFAEFVRRAMLAAVRCDGTKEDMTPSLMQCMEYLYSRGESSIGQIAAGLGISIPGASQLVDRLFKKGLVCRSESAIDRRKTRVALTELGAERVRETRQRRAGWFSSVLDAMPEAHKEAFLVGLESFVRIAARERDVLSLPCVKCPAERTPECDARLLSGREVVGIQELSK